MEFCTWHDSCAVMACAKLCSVMIPYNGVTLIPLFHQILNMMERLFLKWPPGLPFLTLCSGCIVFTGYYIYQYHDCCWWMLYTVVLYSSDCFDFSTYSDHSLQVRNYKSWNHQEFSRGKGWCRIVTGWRPRQHPIFFMILSYKEFDGVICQI